MYPAEVIVWLREAWAWVGELWAPLQPGSIALVSWLALLAVRTWFPGFWDFWANKIGGTQASAWRKACQLLPAAMLGAAAGVILNGDDPTEIIKITFYSLFSAPWHELLKWSPLPYVGGNFPAAGSLKPQTSPLRVLEGYDGDDAPSDPPPPPRVPPAAVLPLLLTIGLGLSQTCCTGSLVTAQHDALRARYGSTPGDVGYAPNERCQSLDRQRTDWAAVEQTAIVVTGASGLSTIPVERLPDRYQDGAYIGLASTAVVGAAVATYAGVKAHAAAEAFVRECAP